MLILTLILVSPQENYSYLNQNGVHSDISFLILPGPQMCNDEAYLRQPTENLQ